MLGWAAASGAALVAAQAAGCTSSSAKQPPAAGRTAGLYSVTDYGAIGDGQANDTAAVQAAVHAASVVGGGTIVWPAGCLTNIQAAITLPSTGNFEFVGAGEAASIYTVNDGFPHRRRTNGILITKAIGKQPAPIGASDRWDFVFDCSAAYGAGGGQGELTVAFTRLMVYNRGTPRPVALALLTNDCYIADFTDCFCAQVALAYLTGRGGAQTYRITIRGCLGDGPMFWADGTAPFLGEVSGNEWYGTGDENNPLPHGHIIEQNTYWTWFVHDNVFQSGATIAAPRADVFIADISQTCLGSIHDNAFYGSPGGCIYWQDNLTWNIANETGGLIIHDNEFTDWNKSDRGDIGAAAVYIDHSKGAPADQLITIGKNNWIGGRHSHFGLVIADNPDDAAVIFDREQNMRGVQTAPYRIAAVNHGRPGASHRFQGSLTAPPIPTTTTALTNPFGFDTTIYLTGGTVSEVAINATATGLTAGMFRLPRGATITVVYSAPPTWAWFAD
jgi:hypothetical protein